MSLESLELTYFEVEKLQCIGGTGRAVPFRITTYRGLELGTTGHVAEAGYKAANEPEFESGNRSIRVGGVRRLLSRFSRSRQD